MINGKELEVVLETPKPVMENNAWESVDVLVFLHAPVHEMVGGSERTLLAVSLVIDQSCSMNGGNLTEAKRCSLNSPSRLQD